MSIPDERPLYPVFVHACFDDARGGMWTPWTDPTQTWVGWKWTSDDGEEHFYVYLVPTDEGIILLYSGQGGDRNLDAFMKGVTP